MGKTILLGVHETIVDKQGRFNTSLLIALKKERISSVYLFVNYSIASLANAFRDRAANQVLPALRRLNKFKALEKHTVFNSGETPLITEIISKLEEAGIKVSTVISPLDLLDTTKKPGWYWLEHIKPAESLVFTAAHREKPLTPGRLYCHLTRWEMLARTENARLRRQLFLAECYGCGSMEGKPDKADMLLYLQDHWRLYPSDYIVIDSSEDILKQLAQGGAITTPPIVMHFHSSPLYYQRQLQLAFLKQYCQKMWLQEYPAAPVLSAFIDWATMQPFRGQQSEKVLFALRDINTQLNINYDDPLMLAERICAKMGDFYKGYLLNESQSKKRPVEFTLQNNSWSRYGLRRKTVGCTFSLHDHPTWPYQQALKTLGVLRYQAEHQCIPKPRAIDPSQFKTPIAKHMLRPKPPH